MNEHISYKLISPCLNPLTIVIISYYIYKMLYVGTRELYLYGASSTQPSTQLREPVGQGCGWKTRSSFCEELIGSAWDEKPWTKTPIPNEENTMENHGKKMTLIWAGFQTIIQPRA